MRKTIIGVGTFLIGNCVFGQKSPSQIEINSYLRWDNYPVFTTPFNSVMNSTIKIKGTSLGIQPNFKFSIKNNFFAKFGLGYHKYSFDHIQVNTRLFGNQSSRIIRRINYPGLSSTFGYTTNKYWYNTLSATIGIEKLFNIKKNWSIITGLNVTNYYTFSQRYILSTIKYKESDGRYFGFSTNIYTGIQKKFGKISVGPNILLPIYEAWKKDEVFPQEENSKNRSKWLRGLGIGITCNYSLKK